MSGFGEECWFLFGIRIWKFSFGYFEYHSKGTSGGVDFDWSKVYDSKFLLGFYHTHPTAEVTNYSPTDEKTMRGWVVCRWRDLICGIWNCDRNFRTCYLFTREKKIRVIWDKIIFDKFYIAKDK